MNNRPVILIVRHGEGRGRWLRYGPGAGEEMSYFQPFFNHIRDHRRALSARLRFFDTGDPQPSLEGIGAVLFLLGDPLAELYPECYQEAVRIRDDAVQRGIPVYQDPDALAGYGRVSQANKWLDAGIPTARVCAFQSRDELREVAGGMGPPLMLRKDHGHCQTDIRLVMNGSAMDKALAADGETNGVVMQFVDCREGYRQDSPHSVYARFYHKKRAHVLGDTVRTNHVYFSEHPIVGLYSSTFWFHRPYKSDLRRPGPYLQRCWRLPDCLREDYAYWEKVVDDEAVLLRAAKALGLSFAAIDYSTLADGSVVLWEANPYPGCVTRSPMPFLRRSRRRATGIFDSLADALERLGTRPEG